MPSGGADVRRMADLLLPPPNGGRRLGAYKFFVDESESGLGTVSVLTGFSATVDSWQKLSARWSEILMAAEHFDANGNLMAFHMCDYENAHPPYDSWDSGKRKSVICDLIDTINECVEGALIVGLPWDLYYSVARINWGMVKDSKEHRKARYMTCLYPMFLVLLATLKNPPPCDRVPIVFDRNKTVSGAALDVMNKVIEDVPGANDLIGPIAFDSKDKFIPLQAADILAYEAMKYRDNKIQNQAFTRRSRERLDRSNWNSFDYDIPHLTTIIAKWYQNTVESGGLVPDAEMHALIRNEARVLRRILD